MNSRDNFSEKTRIALCLRVGGRCSNPECRAFTTAPNVEPNKVSYTGSAAHITAASKNGPRYDPSLSQEQRKSIENGIWLCNNCARMIDVDPVRYSAELLKKWKEEAERKQLSVSKQVFTEKTAKQAEMALNWIVSLYRACDKASLAAEMTLCPDNPDYRRKNYQEYLKVKNEATMTFSSEWGVFKQFIETVDGLEIEQTFSTFFSELDNMIENYIRVPNTSPSVEINNTLFREMKEHLESLQKAVSQLI